MRNAIAIIASLVIATQVADAKPRKHSSKAEARERFMMQCIDERTGKPEDGGLDLDEAEKLCRTIVKHQARITKLATLAAKARAAGIDRLTKRAEWECAEEVSIACEDTTVRDHDDGACSDATLEALHAFDVCRGKAPIHAEGK